MFTDSRYSLLPALPGNIMLFIHREALVHVTFSTF